MGSQGYTLPNVATPDQSTVIRWSNNDLFNGFMLVGLVVPNAGGTTPWAELDLAGQAPGERIPIFTKVPIANGQMSNSVGIIYNTSLSPPNSRYAAWLYDNSVYPPHQVAGPTALFDVLTATFNAPTMTPTAPTAGTVPPVPNA